MDSSFHIYGLVDPRTQELRYVGKSCSGLRRPLAHVTAGALNEAWRTHKANWLRQLRAEGLKPDIEVLETYETAEELPEAERHLIAYFRSIGCRLTNLTAGGEGTTGRHIRPSPETRARMSKAQLGHPGYCKAQSEKARVQNARAHGGRPFVDQNGVRYETVSEAARSIGYSRRGIQFVLQGKYPHVGGYVFRYVE